MGIHEGSRVMVNLAPFIGSKARSRRSIPCRVTAVRAEEIEVTTEEPYRKVVLSIPPRWIDSACVEEQDTLAAVP